MIRKKDLFACFGALAVMLGNAPASAETLTNTPLGTASNFSRLIFSQGVLDFTQTPYPVAYTYTVDQRQVVASDVAINDSISDGARFAGISVSPGIIKASASSSGIIPDTYVQGATAVGGFTDTFSIISSDPTVDWVPVTFRLFVDGSSNSSGGANNYNRAGVSGFFELATALGGQTGGALTTINDFEAFPTTIADPCEETSLQVTCGLYDHIVANSALTFDGLEFVYHALVKPNEQFTLQSGISAGAWSLAGDEWAISDFSNTAIFGGIEVGAGFSVTSLAMGGTLAIQNGVANYDDAFTALTAKYGTATPGVPEPSMWAMMLAGFAMIGGFLRRRHALPACRMAV